jgi:mono/diheme cytochrome c family protein
MKAYRFTQALFVAALTALIAGAYAAEPAKTMGQREYDGHCAVCPGTAGKGDGPFAGIIETKLPDLTTLSKRNGGVFPVERIYAVLEGTAPLKAHGTSVMPIWGQRYRLEAAEYYRDVPYDDRPFVRARILSLTEYLSKLQVK